MVVDSSRIKPRKSHIGLQGGGFTAQISDGDGDEYSESGGFAVLNFRYSLNHRSDFVLDGRFWVTNVDEGDSVTRLAHSSVGPGIHAVFELNGYLRWFIQGTHIIGCAKERNMMMGATLPKELLESA